MSARPADLGLRTPRRASVRLDLELRTILPLGFALLGYWTPWLTHPAASLRLNGYELSEWVTFLPGVRDGTLPIAYLPLGLYFARLAFLIPLACLAWLLGIAAFRFRREAVTPMRQSWISLWLPTTGWGWGVWLLAWFVCYTVFPPYPYILSAYRDPEFQFHFLVAGLTLLGLGLIPILTAELKDAVQVLAALLGGGLGLWALLVLHPVVSNLLHAPWRIGLGWAAMLLGFLGLAWAGWAQFFGPKI